MSADRFPCYQVTKDAAGSVAAAMGEASDGDLPEGDVLIRVRYSSLNYKDALAATGHPGVVRKFPHVPGIDAAGTVERSDSPRFKIGDEVLTTGFGLGADRWGGYSRYVQVNHASVIKRPKGLTLRDCMVLGTAGLTAAISILEIVERGIEPSYGDILVSGATGGVGCLAVSMLAKAGYRVVAVTGKPSAEKFLRGLGAARVVPREEVLDASPKPLLSSRWAAAIDTVGGAMLATILRQSEQGACVAACGMVGGTDLNISVYPFILRGVTLAGIDSDHCPLDRRTLLWQRMSQEWRPGGLESIVREIGLSELPAAVKEILAGQVKGRIVVAVP
ncbi:MAG: YhdH/YhfP family quinone oxidoreductase [Pirellulales bacterium]